MEITTIALPSAGSNRFRFNGFAKRHLSVGQARAPRGKAMARWF